MKRPSLAARLQGTDHDQRVALLELAELWESGPLERQPLRVQHRGRLVEITRADWRQLRKRQTDLDALNHAMASSQRFVPLRGGVSDRGLPRHTAGATNAQGDGRVQRAATVQRSGPNTTEGAGGGDNRAVPPRSIPSSS